MTPPDVRWDLGELAACGGHSTLEPDAAALRLRALAFARAHQGTINDLDFGELRGLLDERDAQADELGRLESLARLKFAADANAPGAAEQQELAARLGAFVASATAFLDRELCRLPREKAQAVLDAPVLAAHRHALAKLLAQAPYRPGQEREAALAALEITDRQRLITRWASLTAGLRIGTRALPLSRTISRLASKNRLWRARAAADLARALAPHREELASIQAGLLDLEQKAARARNLPHRLALADIAEESPGKTRVSVLAAMRRVSPLVARYFRLKKKLLGLTQLETHDINAPVPNLPRFTFEKASSLVLQSFAGVSPAFGEAARAILSNARVDAFPRPGKQTGAFCLTPPGCRLPFLFLNFSGTWRDAAILAHECGHGIHQALSSGLNASARQAAPALAEAVAFFAELAFFQLLLRRTRSPATRLALLCARIEDELTSAPRQAAIFTYEENIRGLFAAKGELAARDLDATWMTAHSDVYGKSVRLTDDYRSLWAVAPHSVVIPGYVRHYPTALCLARGMWRSRTAAPGRFAATLEAVCACGSCQPLTELAMLMGLDIASPALYQSAMEDLAELIREAEDEAHRSQG
jgi:oligoendopeptidase F